MPLDLHPIYHTETMVKILREQGSPQLATELAEKVLQRSPGHEQVAKILAELREEARLAFERFKNSGRAAPEENRAEVPVEVEASAAVTPQPSETIPDQIPVSEAPYADKVKMLQEFLDRIPQGQNQDEKH